MSASTKPQQHGGQRPGAGRRPLDDDEPTKHLAVTITTAHLRILDAIPGANRSAKLRLLLEIVEAKQ